MKKRIKIAVTALALLIAGFWILNQVPFSRQIRQQISAGIYENGVLTGRTAVYIEGKRTHYLFHNNERFDGVFQIELIERTGRDGMNAAVRWSGDDNYQRLIYFQNATFPDMDVVSTLLISDGMSRFALMLTDGTVLATSDELHALYVRHISYNADTGVTSVSDVTGIPKIADGRHGEGPAGF